jgi:DNA-binding transcriptional regulator YhcF (GntR family)
MGNLSDWFENKVQMKIIDCLLNATTDLSKKQIAASCEISKATLFNNWQNLEKLALVKVVRKFGKTKLYQIDKENPIVVKLMELKNLLPEVKKPEKEKKVEIKEVPKEVGEKQSTKSSS